ncbi:uncharacterized protein LOC126235417 [Schistocerca nitens]|uniref:uncharacterized protein LOC126235417 n=1 Tax=Schistocerca nitens TaxID=7011 RepID=UPI0021175BAF|nr:uncharacterized protein LOC126235417 [Schistocerca nitens]
MNTTPIGYEENDQNETEAISSSVPYSEATGCLTYLSIATRTGTSFAVNKAAPAMRKPTASDWNRVKHTFWYLKGTLNDCIIYDREENLRIYSDADFAGDRQTRRSTTGIVAKYHGGAI